MAVHALSLSPRCWVGICEVPRGIAGMCSVRARDALSHKTFSLFEQMFCSRACVSAWRTCKRASRTNTQLLLLFRSLLVCVRTTLSHYCHPQSHGGYPWYPRVHCPLSINRDSFHTSYHWPPLFFTTFSSTECQYPTFVVTL